MPLRALTDDRLDASLAIVLLAAEADDVARCLSALLTTLDARTPLLAGGTDAGRRALADLIGDRDVLWLEADGAQAWNRAAEAAPSADFVLLDAATEVGEHWLDDLRAVQATEPDAATITPISNSAAFLSAPNRNLAWPLLPPSVTPEQASDRVRARSLRLHPRVPTALPHATLVARRAIGLAGAFDVELAPRQALADFCVRCSAVGLAHVAADEVFVAHRGDPVEGTPGYWHGEAAERHPALAAAVDEVAHDRYSALARSLLTASVALEPLQVTVDARCLGPGVTGTIVHTVELLGALADREDVRVRALLPARIGDESLQALESMRSIESMGADQLNAPFLRSHVVHRPWQIEDLEEMALLETIAERTVLTNQDLIGYRDANGFGSPEEWLRYRRATRDAFGLAALVLFFSRTAAADALADDLLPADRVRVVPLGTRPERLRFEGEPRRPSALSAGGRPFLLVLGNRFRHKNVRFAMDLLAALRDEHSWDGELVIAGSEVRYGSGSGDEAAWRLRNPDHASHVHAIGAVDEAEKAWLLAASAAVAYPSTYEGFGLIPFEAAAAGTPCLMAHASALRDTFAPDLALLTAWDATASARRSVPVLSDGPEREQLIAGIRAAGEPLTWAATGEALVAAYRDAVRLSLPAGARLTHDLGEAQNEANRVSVPARAVRRLRRLLSGP